MIINKRFAGYGSASALNGLQQPFLFPVPFPVVILINTSFPGPQSCNPYHGASSELSSPPPMTMFTPLTSTPSSARMRMYFTPSMTRV